MAGDNDTFKEQGSSQAGGIAPEDPNSGARKNQQSETIPLSGTVGSMSPEYPKHRDALIICASIIILIVLVAGGYFLVKDKSISFPKIAQEPVQFVRNLLKGGETYGICSNFIRTHKGLFKELGGDLEWSLVKQEIRVVNKDKKAKICLFSPKKIWGHLADHFGVHGSGEGKIQTDLSWEKIQKKRCLESKWLKAQVLRLKA
ncbi:MAG: hypothetical protein JRK53_26200 [Deltaproteobacteria bacterium]|nr:hypothetical protein [Deltaproteobacteria bacterium]